METDKIKLNDQIVLLRRWVKVAKVHTVRRLFRQMKMWRQKKGKTEDDTKKYQRKAERLKEEISIITKSDPDVISKMALKEEKDWKAVILQKDTTVEQRSLAHLINHKQIQEKVSQFREANPDWQSWLPSTLNRWERKKQAKLERMNSVPPKDKSANLGKEKDSISESGDSTNERDDEKIPENVVEEQLNKTNLLSDNEIKENKKKGKNKNQKGKFDKQNRRNTKHKVEADAYKDAISKYFTKTKSSVIERVEGNMEIAEINLDNLEDQEMLPVQRASHADVNASTDDAAKPEKKLKDAFFLGTGSDESNQDSCSEPEQPLSSDGEPSLHKPKTQFISSLSGSRGNDFSRLRERINPKFFPKQDQNLRKINKPRQKQGTKMQFDKFSHRNNRRFPDRTDSSKMESTTGSTQESTKLHPSWEAKRKIKQTAMLPFRGKKIRFDVND